MKQDKNFCPFFSAPLFAKGRQSVSWLPRTHVNRTKSIWFEKRTSLKQKVRTINEIFLLTLYILLINMSILNWKVSLQFPVRSASNVKQKHNHSKKERFKPLISTLFVRLFRLQSVKVVVRCNFTWKGMSHLLPLLQHLAIIYWYPVL